MLGSESEQAAQTTVQIEQCAARANLCRQRGVSERQNFRQGHVGCKGCAQRHHPCLYRLRKQGVKMRCFVRSWEDF